MEKDVQKLIDAGQTEDTVIVHAAPGEMVVPPVISNQTQQMINRDMQSVGLNPAEYMVGQGSINNLTGLQEFGCLSKLFKKVKNVVKKVAPIAVSFIPGVGPVAKAALTAGIGKASGMSTKEALLAGATAGLGAKFSGAGATGAASKVAGETAKKGIFGGTFGPRIKSGLGSFFKPGKDATGIFGGKLGPNIRSGIGNIFSGGLGGGQQLGQVTTQTGEFGEQIYTAADGTEVTAAQLQEAGYTFDASGNPIAPTQTTGPFGGTLGPKLRETFLGSGDQPGVLGNLVGGGQQSGGLGLGGTGNLAALAALYGLATKKAAEKTEGGLRDIRLSTRPDLMPQQTFQGFDVGVRPGIAYGGGITELDMRMGGPSEGPGTETSDDIPAMLSDGEFVHTAKANKGLGGFKIEKNKNSITLFPAGKPDREQGFKNNDMMMKMFENYQKMMS